MLALYNDNVYILYICTLCNERYSVRENNLGEISVENWGVMFDLYTDATNLERGWETKDTSSNNHGSWRFFWFTILHRILRKSKAITTDWNSINDIVLNLWLLLSVCRSAVGLRYQSRRKIFKNKKKKNWTQYIRNTKYIILSVFFHITLSFFLPSFFLSISLAQGHPLVKVI